MGSIVEQPIIMPVRGVKKKIAPISGVALKRERRRVLSNIFIKI
jgi:hypothetical protein